MWGGGSNRIAHRGGITRLGSLTLGVSRWAPFCVTYKPRIKPIKLYYALLSSNELHFHWNLSRDAACNLDLLIDSMMMSLDALLGSRLQGHECKRKTA